MIQKWFEGYGLMVSIDDVTEEMLKYRRLMDTCDDLHAQLFNVNAETENLYRWIKSDSVHTALRYAFKNPSKTCMDDIEDKHYIDMYNLSKKLRELDAKDIENRNDAFDSQLP
jgi:hypothetical protein